MQGINKKNGEKINVLVFGSGAREHAIADALSNSCLLGKLYLASSGHFELGEVIEYTSYDNLAEKCSLLGVDLAVFGPEEPICKGIADVFRKHNIPCIGVDKYFSQLESSKLFAKNFMNKHGIKTAKYSSISYSVDYSKNCHCPFIIPHAPFVIKADGLCGGKGVVIAYDEEFAQKTIDEFLRGRFGQNSKTILLEEFLGGEEISLMSLWDGKSLLNFKPARDFKRLSAEPDAPNTGGMGAYCPVTLSSNQQQKLDNYLLKLENALKNEQAGFKGFLYSGLIWAKEDWYVLEYNVRLGDPETQAILSNLQTDFLSVLKAAVEGRLEEVSLEYKNKVSGCLTVACEGYPNSPKDGKLIKLPPVQEGIKIFRAGVKEINGKMYSKGGRVLSLCTTSNKPFNVLKKFAKQIQMQNKYFREDIDLG